MVKQNICKIMLMLTYQAFGGGPCYSAFSVDTTDTSFTGDNLLCSTLNLSRMGQFSTTCLDLTFNIFIYNLFLQPKGRMAISMASKALYMASKALYGFSIKKKHSTVIPAEEEFVFKVKSLLLDESDYCMLSYDLYQIFTVCYLRNRATAITIKDKDGNELSIESKLYKNICTGWKRFIGDMYDPQRANQSIHILGAMLANVPLILRGSKFVNPKENNVNFCVDNFRIPMTETVIEHLRIIYNGYSNSLPEQLNAQARRYILAAWHFFHGNDLGKLIWTWDGQSLFNEDSDGKRIVFILMKEEAWLRIDNWDLVIVDSDYHGNLILRRDWHCYDPLLKLCY